MANIANRTDVRISTCWWLNWLETRFTMKTDLTQTASVMAEVRNVAFLLTFSLVDRQAGTQSRSRQKVIVPRSVMLNVTVRSCWRPVNRMCSGIDPPAEFVAPLVTVWHPGELLRRIWTQ